MAVSYVAPTVPTLGQPSGGGVDIVSFERVGDDIVLTVRNCCTSQLQTYTVSALDVVPLTAPQQEEPRG